jgi:hypothetical protein
LVAGVVEAQIPRPHEQVLLTRSILVHATPAEIWPYAVSNRSISTSEGRWTINKRRSDSPGGWLSASFQAARKKAPTRNLSLNFRVSPQGGTPVL